MRLFFALWPDAPAAARLERLSHDLAIVAGGKVTRPEKIHLTLAFLGEVGEDRLRDALSVRLRRAPVALRLDCVGSFRRARVAWAASLSPNEPLAALQSSLAGLLRARGFVLEERPFAPHVTLVRGTRHAVPRAAIAPIEWTGAEFRLMRSDTATGRYETVKAWPLAR